MASGNPKKSGDIVTVVAPVGGVVSGQFVKIGDLYGWAATTAAEGASVELIRKGEGTIPKEATTVTFDPGDRVYWDVADGEANDDNANPLVMVCTVAAGATGTTVRGVLVPPVA